MHKFYYFRGNVQIRCNDELIKELPPYKVRKPCTLANLKHRIAIMDFVSRFCEQRRPYVSCHCPGVKDGLFKVLYRDMADQRQGLRKLLDLAVEDDESILTTITDDFSNFHLFGNRGTTQTELRYNLLVKLFIIYMLLSETAIKYCLFPALKR